MKEKSCGSIIFKYDEEKLLFLVIKQTLGHFSFPKGHVEESESEKDTALREVKEETGFDISFVGDFREVITYCPKPRVLKDVVFFLGNVIDGVMTPQKDEVSLIEWLSYEDALKVVTYDDDKNVLKKAYEYIVKNNF